MEAEDVVQDALLHAYGGLDRLREPAMFGAWLRGIAVNLARMRIRSQRRIQLVGLVDDHLAGGQIAGPEEEFEALERARAVELALACLSAPQRQVLLAHELGGLSCVEIAARDGSSAGAVRARLFRARQRLRAELHAFAPRHKVVMRMVEMELYDVMVRLPTARQMETMLAAPQVIVLRERSGQRALPIFVGTVEGGTLALHRGGAQPPRPMTIDFVTHLIDALGAEVERVAVTSLREGTFYSLVRVAGAELDARPSDAINIAVRTGAPILVEEEVLSEGSVDAGDLAAGLENLRCNYRPSEEPGEWRSLSPDLVLEAWRPWRSPHAKP